MEGGGEAQEQKAYPSQDVKLPFHPLSLKSYSYTDLMFILRGKLSKKHQPQAPPLLGTAVKEVQNGAEKRDYEK